MQLKECVESLSTQTLIKILQHHPPYTLEMEESCDLSFLLEQDYLQMEWEKMSDTERQIIQTFLIDFRQSYLSFSKVNTVFPIPFPEIMVGLTKLRQKGFIYTHRRYFGEVAFFIPTDLQEAFCKMLVQSISQLSLAMETDLSFPNHFYEELWRILHLIDDHPLLLTQRGFIHKKYLPKLEEECSKAFEAIPIHYEGAQIYSKTLAVLLDFAIYHELVMEINDQLQIHETQIDQWIHQTEEWRVKQLWNYIKERLLPFFSLEGVLLFTWCVHIHFGRWYAEENLQAFFQNFSNHIPFTPKTNQIPEANLFVALGLIEIKEINGGNWIGKPNFKTTEMAFCYLQSNFQLFVPNTVSILYRWKVMQFADHVKTDHMFIYECNKQSVERAVEKGWDEETLFEFLKPICLDIPENVQITLKAWIEQSTRMRFVDVTLLECKNEQIALELQNQSIFSPFIIGRLHSNYLIVDPALIEQFQQKLFDAGYSPVKKVFSYNYVNNQKCSSSPLLHLPLTIDPKVENIYPDWEDVFPEIRTIPKVWIDKPRAYHSSSLQDLLKRAIKHHLRISFSLLNGDVFDQVSPILIQEISGELMLKFMVDPTHGGSESQIALSEIKVICAHLPFQMN